MSVKPADQSGPLEPALLKVFHHDVYGHALADELGEVVGKPRRLGLRLAPKRSPDAS